MHRHRSTVAPTFDDEAGELEAIVDLAARGQDHWLGQAGDLAGPKPGFVAQQEYDTVAGRVPEIVHMG